jgi:hypothetical protein
MDSSDQVEPKSEFNDSWDFSTIPPEKWPEILKHAPGAIASAWAGLSQLKATLDDHKRLRSSAEEQGVRSQMAR